MEYVNPGSSGLKVSRLCLGRMAFGSMKWREWVLPEEKGRKIIRHEGLAIDDAVAALEILDDEPGMRALEDSYRPHPVLGHS